MRKYDNKRTKLDNGVVGFLYEQGYPVHLIQFGGWPDGSRAALAISEILIL